MVQIGGDEFEPWSPSSPAWHFAGCGNNAGSGPVASFALTSASFRDGQPIPAQFTCDGANHSPPLAWGEPPRGTKSFALVVDDPDAPGGTFRHWGAYDIPPNARSIAAGQAIGFRRSTISASRAMAARARHRGTDRTIIDSNCLRSTSTSSAFGERRRSADVENAANQHAVGQRRADRDVRAASRPPPCRPT